MELSETFHALGDPTRLRLLRLVAAARLNVTEIVSVIGVAQSSVSHHLAKLKALELVREERVGGFTYYSLAVDATDARWPLIRLARESDDAHGDQARLTELLRRREDRHTLNEKLLEPGQSWLLWASALSSLLPKLDVADFGCGSGVLTLELSRWARHVTAIDRSPQALEQARARLAREKCKNVSFVEADLHELPPGLPKHDLVVISQSLHHVSDPAAVLAQAAQLLKPGGRLVVMELSPHGEAWVKARLGHQHLGFEPAVLEAALTASGFTDVTLTPTPRDGSSPFRAFLLTATRPSRPSKRTAREARA
ncbi:MAG: metalloregulator ArsR/SmtB family transcription factor [Myxococcus sp.]|nr:metalloregulator ArsR/SmtB family transcription factor [Myxococcus sp.]